MTDELAARRWANNNDPKAHKPLDALKAAVRAIECGELDPKHVIVVYCTDEGGGHTGYFQGGKLDSYFGAIGLLSRARDVMASTT